MWRAHPSKTRNLGGRLALLPVLLASACGYDRAQDADPPQQTETAALEATTEDGDVREREPGSEGEAIELGLGFGIPSSVHCDKVTTFVCPGNDCLCKQKDCALPNHNGDYAPCSGPPVPGCQHDLQAPQYCFPPLVPIPCNAMNVPVNMCGLPCRSGGVTYTPEANGCCRGERKCHPPKKVVPIGGP